MEIKKRGKKAEKRKKRSRKKRKKVEKIINEGSLSKYDLHLVIYWGRRVYKTPGTNPYQRVTKEVDLNISASWSLIKSFVLNPHKDYF